jgi:predicted MPP superfamily phosphohydrolase
MTQTRIRNLPAWRYWWDRAYGALTVGDWPARLAWRLRPCEAIAVERFTVTVPALSERTARLRIAFASDFHAGPATAWALLAMSVARLESLRPDLLLLGGDFVAIDPRHGERLIARLGTIAAPLGRFAVLGNHDYWSGATRVVQQLEAAGITMLTNRGIRLPPPFDHVSIVGLDDHTSGSPDAEAAFAGAGPVRVVLMHAPSGLLDLGDRDFVVALCGHTHGGQIARADGRPVVVASGALSRLYNAGRYALPGGRTLLVSRGVGCGTLPIRVNAPSGVVLCDLVPIPASATAGNRWDLVEPSATA